MMRNYNGSQVGGDVYGNSGLSGGWNNGRQESRTLSAPWSVTASLIRTLAEPNLTAISGETAKFLAGGEYPIPVVDSMGALRLPIRSSA